jgi:hypothetical protein
MLERDRMVLESCVNIAQGRMARIPRFSKEAEVRELQLPCDAAARCKQLPGPRLNRPRVQHEQGKGHDIDDRQDEEDGGLAYAGGFEQDIILTALSPQRHRGTEKSVSLNLFLPHKSQKTQKIIFYLYVFTYVLYVNYVANHDFVRIHQSCFFKLALLRVSVSLW